MSGYIRRIGIALAAILIVRTAPEARAEVLLGDASGDGTITLFDAKLIEDHILGRSPLTGAALARADANGDGRVDVADIIAVRASPSPVVVAPGVINMDADVNWAVDAVTTTTLSVRWLGSGVAPIHVGSIVVGSASGGFLRRVESITSGADILLATTYAALTDVIQGGQFSNNGALGLSASKTIGSTINLANVSLEVVPGQIDVNLSRLNVQFNPSWHFEGAVEGSKLKYLHIDIAADPMVDLAFTVQAEQSLQLGMAEKDLLAPGTANVPIDLPFAFGISTPLSGHPIPVTGIIEVGLPVKLDISTSAALTNLFQYQRQTKLRLGFDYVDGQFTPIKDASIVSATSSNQAFNGEATFDVNLSARLGFKIFFYDQRVAYPEIKIGPKLAYERTRTVNPPACSDKLDLYVSADESVNLDAITNEGLTWSLPAMEVLGPFNLVTRDCSADAPGQEHTVILPGGVPLTLVRIPRGSFQMGSVDSGWSYPNEAPVHPVTINYDYYMGKFELTQAQWLAVAGAWPGLPPNACGGSGSNFPAYYITWNDIQSFLTTLNGLGLGGTFRLPSEAEWEYAARGGTQTRFPFGDSTCLLGSGTDCDLSQYEWWGASQFGSCGEPTWGSKIVGGKLPNAYGLCDTGGNVWEWCQDWYHPTYVGAPADGSAWNVATYTRVVRGGGYFDDPSWCRPTVRHGEYPPDSQYIGIGARLAWSP